VELPVVDGAAAVGERHQHVDEAVSPADAVGRPGVPGVHRLRQRLVEAGHRGDQVDVLPRQALGRLAEEGALRRDGVDHEPGEGEEGRLAAPEVEVVDAADLLSLWRALGAQQHEVGLGLGDLVAALVRHPDEQRRDAVEAGDHHVAAEDHAGGGAGELGEDEARDERQAEEADERLDGHEQVRDEPARRHLAVADGGHGLDAEEEGVREAPGPRLLDAVADGEVARREEQVRAEVGDEDDAEELGPGGGEKRVVDVAQRRVAEADGEDLAPRAGQAGDAVSGGSVGGHAGGT